MLRKVFAIPTKIKEAMVRIFKAIVTPKFITLSLLVLILTVITGLNAYKFYNNPQSCSLCHEMKPEFVTWRASVHSKYVCTDCHKQSGLTGTVKTFTVRLYQHFTKTYNNPIEMTDNSKNDICLSCHSAARIVTPPSDLEFPHKKHVLKGFDCVECHTGSAHGNILEKGYTTLTNYDTWTVGMGRAYMEEKFIITPMEKCMECHKDNQVSNDCATCHTDIGIPEDHQQENWKTEHGRKAEENVWNCDKCHSYTNNWLRFSEGTSKVADYARNNMFCSKCHVGMEGTAKDFPSNTKSKNANKRGSKITNYKPIAPAPPSHNDTWRQTHGPPALADKDGCLVCHDEIRNPKANSTTTYCTKCHKVTHKPSKFHPIKLEGRKLDSSCIRCHAAKGCNRCHAIKEEGGDKIGTSK